MERYLGTISRGWHADPNGNRLPFQIVEFIAGPEAEVRSLATLGLSAGSLRVGDSNSHVCHEFVMLYRADEGPANLPAVLQQVAMECYTAGRTYLRGEVIGPRGTLVDGFNFNALYVAQPVYFPDGFAVYRPADVGDQQQRAPSVTFVWLFPVTARETEMIANFGWEFFERKLERLNPDLTSRTRETVQVD
ncbi:MAG TPA: suppressor of fused domain protein [Kofleriaceae bacterium]|nr:suppressor of fused domain protein [Kofleriaceae bacterium]